jgi:glycosyltransferase involved in cell wall biosynthesis
LTKRDIDLLYVGGTHGRKNPGFLRECLKKAEEEGYTVRTLTGESGWPGEELGELTDEDLAEVYRRTRLYLHPSYVEGFGRPPVEAQRYGAIPLALDTAVNREVLGEKGEAWGEIEDPEDVVEFLKHGAHPEKRQNAKENAQEYSWSETREKFLQELMVR